MTKGRGQGSRMTVWYFWRENVQFRGFLGVRVRVRVRSMVNGGGSGQEVSGPRLKRRWGGVICSGKGRIGGKRLFRRV